MKFSVKMIVKHSVETGEVYLEESIVMLDAASFDDAYLKAEKYVEDNEISCTYDNFCGKRVRTEVLRFADCFSVYDDEDAVEVYSSFKKCGAEMPEDTLLECLTASCSRRDMLPLRQWLDSDESK